MTWALLLEVTNDPRSSTWGHILPKALLLEVTFYLSSSLRSHMVWALRPEFTYDLSSSPWGHMWPELFSFLLEVTCSLSPSTRGLMWPELFSLLKSHATWAHLLQLYSVRSQVAKELIYLRSPMAWEMYPKSPVGTCQYWRYSLQRCPGSWSRGTSTITSWPRLTCPSTPTSPCPPLHR